MCVCVLLYLCKAYSTEVSFAIQGRKKTNALFFFVRVPVKRKTCTNALSGVRGQNSSELCMLEEGGEGGGGWGVLTPTQAQNLQKKTHNSI